MPEDKSKSEEAQQVIEKLMREHSGRLYAFLRSRITDRLVVEDLVQDVWLKVYRNLDNVPVDDSETFTRWLLRVAQTVSIDHMRRKARAKDVFLDSESIAPGEKWQEALKLLIDNAAEVVEQRADDRQSSFANATNDREISVFVDPGDAPSELIAQLYASLDALYRSCDGSGLRVASEERRTFIGEAL